MKIEFSDEAKAELRAARERYESEREGLGREFVLVVRHLLRLIADGPLHFQTVTRTKARCAVARRFPFKIVFLVMGARIRVLAIAHQKQRPQYWSRRT
jgi:plasmid stabilization system protein ParE